MRIFESFFDKFEWFFSKSNFLYKNQHMQLAITTKHQRMNTQPVKTNPSKYIGRLRYITNIGRTVLKLTNTKKK